MVKDCQRITVHAVTFAHQRGPVLYASLPHDIAPPAGPRTAGEGGGTRHRLVSILWGHLAAMERPLGKNGHPADRAALPLQVVRGPLGKPHLLVGTSRGPAISFSECGGKVWAALCGDESEIGIDVAGTDEFQGDYPVHRVFHAHELQQASLLSGGDAAMASALLWSIKESVVKALGCGFHLVDPREIRVHPSGAEGGGYAFSAWLSKKALARFPERAQGSLWIRSFPREKTWLSLALLDRQP